MRQLWDSHETVMRQSWDSHETIMRKSWESSLLYSSCRPLQTCLFSSVQWDAEWVASLMGGHKTMACLSGKGHGKNVQTWTEQKSSSKSLDLDMTPPAPLGKNPNRSIFFLRIASLSSPGTSHWNFLESGWVFCGFFSTYPQHSMFKTSDATTMCACCNRTKSCVPKSYSGLRVWSSSVFHTIRDQHNIVGEVGWMVYALYHVLLCRCC